MEHAVELQRLPEGVEFPPEIRERIRFDPVRRRLVFRGVMSKLEYDHLSQLHPALDYQASLEVLFRISTVHPTSLTSRWFWAWSSGLAIFCVLVAVYVWWRLLQDIP